MRVHGVEVAGVDVDAQTRCRHYHSEADIVAIRFPCCDTYYPCHLCHAEVASHPPAVWKRERFGERAVLCGACGAELAIAEYLRSHAACPVCGARFNPGCAAHRHLYFDVPAGLSRRL